MSGHIPLPELEGDSPLPELEGYSECEIIQHVKLCEEAGFMDVVIDARTKRPTAIIRMSWDGYEALDRRCK